MRPSLNRALPLAPEPTRCSLSRRYLYRAKIPAAALVKHFLDVAGAATIPELLCGTPQNTVVAIAPDQVAQLGEHPNIIGIKDSSGEYFRFAEYFLHRHLVPPFFRV